MGTTATKRTGNFVSIVFATGGANFLFSSDTTANPGGLSNVAIRSIMWKTASDGDTLIIRDGGSTGAVVFIDEAADSANARIKYYGGGSGKGVVMNPSITVAQCVYSSAGAAGTVVFELA